MRKHRADGSSRRAASAKRGSWARSPCSSAPMHRATSPARRSSLMAAGSPAASPRSATRSEASNADWDRKPGFDLTGKRALVVGCANPAGRAIALAPRGGRRGHRDRLRHAGWRRSNGGEAHREGREAAWAAKRSRRAGTSTLPTNVQVGLKQIGREFGQPIDPRVQRRRAASRSRSRRRRTPSSAGSRRGQQSGRVLRGTVVPERAPGRRSNGRIIFFTSVLAERGVGWNTRLHRRQGSASGT